MASHAESTASSVSRRVLPPDGADLTVGSSIRPIAELSGETTHISTRPPVGSGDGLIESPGFAIGQTLVGKSLDHFLLEEFVGGGGMGAVFRGHDKILDRHVAIKVLARDRISDPETYQRFLNEGKSAARLDHPNVARVFHAAEANGLAYIVFEFVEGINLRDLVLERKRLPVAESVRYALQIAEALAHASHHNVVHRDVKPSNVIVNPDGHVKLVDMGLARVQSHDTPHEDLTASGVTLGTFDYISPEQARDPRFADVRSDIYSLGCTLYYMLTGRPPYPEGTVLQKLLQHQGDAAPDPRDLNSDVPQEVAAIVGKAMAKDPDLRYQNAPELVADLLLVGERLGLRTGANSGVIWVSTPEAPARWIDRHSPWLAGAAVLICTVLLFDYLWSGRRTAEVVIVRPQPVAPTASSAASVENPPAQESLSPSESVESSTAAAATGQAARNNGTIEQTVVRSPDTSVPPNAPRANDISAATRTTTTPRETTPRVNPTATAVVEPTAARAGVLVVDPTGVSAQSYPSVFAACSMARSGDVVELRFNGRHEERALVLSNLNLTIRAARGYSPVLVFRPATKNSGERTMVSVSGGRVTLVDTAVELELGTDGQRGQATLFELQGAEGLTLRKCSLTARDLSWDRTTGVRATFVNLVSPFAASAMPPSDSGDLADATYIELEDCIVRGEADFLTAPQPWPFSLAWDNGLLAINGRLANLQAALMPLDGALENDIELRHLTAITPLGLCRFNADGPAVFLPPTEVRLYDSLVQCNVNGALIEHVGINPLAQAPPIFTWRGQRNIYDVMNMWRTGADPATPFSGTSKEFNDWLAIWKDREMQPRQSSIVWLEPVPAARAMHLRTPTDFVLDPDAPENFAAIASASDARDLGVDASELPALPKEAATPPTLESRPQPTSPDGMGDMMP